MFKSTGTTKRALPALGAAILAASMLASGSAYAIAQRPTLAQDPGACATGTHWRAVLPDGIAVTMACPGVHQDQAFYGRAAALRGARAQLREPLYTGSIRTAEARPADHTMMVAGPQSCRPGAYWMMRIPNNVDKSTPIACH